MQDRARPKSTKPRHTWESPTGGHKRRRCRRCGCECITVPAKLLAGYRVGNNRGVTLYSPDGLTWYASNPGCIPQGDHRRPSWAHEMPTDWGKR